MRRALRHACFQVSLQKVRIRSEGEGEGVFRTFTPLGYACICVDEVLHMFIRFSFSKAFDCYIIIIIIYKLYFMILFDQNISKIIYFIVSRNRRKYALFNKTSFFFKTKKLTVGKILDLYTIKGALSIA